MDASLARSFPAPDYRLHSVRVGPSAASSPPLACTSRPHHQTCPQAQQLRGGRARQQPHASVDAWPNPTYTGCHAGSFWRCVPAPRGGGEGGVTCAGAFACMCSPGWKGRRAGRMSVCARTAEPQGARGWRRLGAGGGCWERQQSTLRLPLSAPPERGGMQRRQAGGGSPAGRPWAHRRPEQVPVAPLPCPSQSRRQDRRPRQVVTVRSLRSCGRLEIDWADLHAAAARYLTPPLHTPPAPAGPPPRRRWSRRGTSSSNQGCSPPPSVTLPFTGRPQQQSSHPPVVPYTTVVLPILKKLGLPHQHRGG